jgi:hypothetical protein
MMGSETQRPTRRGSKRSAGLPRVRLSLLFGILLSLLPTRGRSECGWPLRGLDTVPFRASWENPQPDELIEAEEDFWARRWPGRGPVRFNSPEPFPEALYVHPAEGLVLTIFVGGLVGNTAIAAATVLLISWIVGGRRTRVTSGHCPVCNYDLTGNMTGRCPECGERFRALWVIHLTETRAESPSDAAAQAAEWQRDSHNANAYRRTCGDRVQTATLMGTETAAEAEQALRVIAELGPLSDDPVDCELRRYVDDYELWSPLLHNEPAQTFEIFSASTLRENLRRLVELQRLRATQLQWLRRHPGDARWLKWVMLGLTMVLWVATWPQILPRDADLPPCHMFVLILISGAATVYLFRKDRRARRLRR